MAEFVGNNVGIILANREISSQIHTVQLQLTKDAPEVTPFGSSVTSREYSPKGLKGVNFSAEGYWQAGDSAKIDDILQARMINAPSGNLIGVGAKGLAAGNAVYCFGCSITANNPFGGNVGDVAKVSLSAMPNTRGYRCISLDEVTAQQVGAAASTDIIAAHLFVTAFTGTNATIKVQSDTASGFPSATDRITFDDVTSSNLDNQVKTLAGPVTDDWWKLDLSGTYTTLGIFVGLAIAPS